MTAAAQRMAVEHAYTFDEPIPIESFLEGVSLLFQECCCLFIGNGMDCSVIVASILEDDSLEFVEMWSGKIYRVFG